MTNKEGWVYDLHIEFRMYCADVFEADAIASDMYVDSFMKAITKKIDEINQKHKNLDYIVSIDKIDTMYDVDYNDILLVGDFTILCAGKKGRKNAEKFCKGLVKAVDKWNYNGHKSRKFRKLFNIARSCNAVIGEAAYASHKLDRLRSIRGRHCRMAFE